MSYTTLDPTDFIVSIDSVTAPAWSSNLPTLTTFFTASQTVTTGISQDAFYLNVYQTASNTNGASVQFSIAYGNINGSGSQYYNTLVPGITPSLSTYKQYRTLIYGTALTSSNQGFNFGGQGTNATNIFVINVDRNRYKESLFPGTFNLKLSGSAGEIQLTDNSNDIANSSSPVTYLDCGRAYSIVSGSNGYAATTNNTSQIANGQTIQGSYGLYLPDIATIVLNGDALALAQSLGGIGLTINQTANTNTPSSSINNTALFQAISQSRYFQLNSQEQVSSNYVFVRIKNGDYNYTTNPTYISGSGDLVYSTLINNPQTYITTVGMYNTANELLAVAKMSRPLLKDFTKEALLRVKLDW
jgi:hypothetical protein